jgi:hypothetical protein
MERMMADSTALSCCHEDLRYNIFYINFHNPHTRGGSIENETQKHGNLNGLITCNMNCCLLGVVNDLQHSDLLDE